MHSYEYNGKRYDFILSMRAKVAIEEAQKDRQRLLLRNPAIAGLLKQAKFGGGDEGEGIDASILQNLEPGQLTELAGLMDEQTVLSPVEIGFLILSSYPPYRDEVTRDFFDALVDSMDVSRGVEETADFFNSLADEVFTTLARMAEKQAQKAASRESLLSVVK